MRRWTVACINWTHPDAPHAAVYLNVDGEAKWFQFFPDHAEAIRYADTMAYRTIPKYADLRAAETFTHPTTPTAADKAAGDDHSSQEGQS